MNKEVDNKNSSKTSTFGVLIGLGLMFAGGQNSKIKILDENNRLLKRNFVGLYYFL